MYEDYFGLERPPFKITPDTSLFFEGGRRGDILAALVYAIHRGEGIIKVVGEVGSGKTMLCRMLQLELPETVEIVYIANPSVSAEDILFVIAHELSISVSRQATKHEVMHSLQDYLLQRHMENKQVVLFIEEAQGMPLETLEEIRLLSNLETDEDKLLQIILFGQPELDQNLAKQSIRQLRERITHNFDLEPLTRDEIHNYLNFRMREVGYTGPELISAAVARKIEQHSEGLLRRINIIADKILLSAFSEGTHNLGAKHVTAAVNDSAFAREVSRGTWSFWWIGLLVIVALAFGLYQSQALWNSSLSAVSMTKQENAATNDKPVTDIAIQTLQTDHSKTLATETKQATDKESSAESRQAGENKVTTMVAGQGQSGSDRSGNPPAKSDVEQGNVVVSRLTGEEEQAKQVAGLSSASNQAATGAEQSDDTSGLTDDYDQWLDAKLKESRDWLNRANRDSVSIQVMMRSKSAVRELVYYLRNEWPLDLSKTYLYEFHAEGLSTYRVFYSEFDTVSSGRNQLELLPDAVKVNEPYLDSVYRMQKALL